MFWIGHQFDDAKRPTYRIVQAQSAAEALAEICGVEISAVGEARGKIDAGPASYLIDAETFVKRLEAWDRDDEER